MLTPKSLGQQLTLSWKSCANVRTHALVAELPAPVEPELPADDRARSDGCASIDEPATRALVLRALERNLDLELEATRLREKMEQYRADCEGYC